MIDAIYKWLLPRKNEITTYIEQLLAGHSSPQRPDTQLRRSLEVLSQLTSATDSHVIAATSKRIDILYEYDHKSRRARKPAQSKVVVQEEGLHERLVAALKDSLGATETHFASPANKNPHGSGVATHAREALLPIYTDSCTSVVIRLLFEDDSRGQLVKSTTVTHILHIAQLAMQSAMRQRLLQIDLELHRLLPKIEQHVGHKTWTHIDNVLSTLAGEFPFLDFTLYLPSDEEGNLLLFTRKGHAKGTPPKRLKPEDCGLLLEDGRFASITIGRDLFPICVHDELVALLVSQCLDAQHNTEYHHILGDVQRIICNAFNDTYHETIWEFLRSIHAHHERHPVASGVLAPKNDEIVALQSALFPYLHLWIYDEADNRLQCMNMPHIAVPVDDNTLVGRVWTTQKDLLLYGVGRDSPIIRFHEIVPADNYSWAGTLFRRYGHPAGVISCFDKNGVGSDRLLTRLDLITLRFCGLLLGLEMDLAQKTRLLQKNRHAESHQISAHLQSILQNIYLLEKRLRQGEPADTRAARPPPVLLANVKAFARLAMRNLSSLSLLGDANQQFMRERQSLTKCIAESVSMLRVLLSSEDREVGIFYEDKYIEASYSYPAVQEVLLIVMLNAVKYCAIGVPVYVEFDDCGIRVKNVGLGIVPGEEGLIFGEGVQGSNVTHDMALECEEWVGHRGLGLFLARRLMQSAGGEVRILAPGRLHSDDDLDTIRQTDITEEDYTCFEIKL